MQAIILVLGAKILINLHQPLRLFFGAQYLEHFLLVAKNIVFHKTKQFVIAGFLAGLKDGVESLFQIYIRPIGRPMLMIISRDRAEPISCWCCGRVFPSGV